MSDKPVLAVDVGGTKIAVGVVTRQGYVLSKSRQPTDLAGPEAVVEQIMTMARQIDGVYPIGGAGVCVPAVLEADTDRVLWAPNLPGWENVSLREMLQARLEVPVFVEYDGQAAALGEWWVGAGRGCQNVACIIIGTGIGGGFVVEGRLWRGRNRLAGAVGWMPLLGPEGVDHWENLASGPAIARRAKTLIEQGNASVLNASALTTKDVFDAAREGDGLAQQVVKEAAALIGQGTAAVISLANPEIVVLGGSIGQQGDLLLDTVREHVRRWAQPVSAKDALIVSSTLGEEAGLLGAAYAAYLRGV